MKPFRGASKGQDPGARFYSGRANWMLIAVLVLVAGQVLMSPPVAPKVRSFISAMFHKRTSAQEIHRPTVESKPWGDLEYDRILLEPPDEFLSDAVLPSEKRNWFFGPEAFKQLFNQLHSTALTSEQRALLQDTNRWKSATNGYYFSPESSLLLGMNSKARQEIYSLLANHPENAYHYNPFSFHVETVEERFADCRLSSETTSIVKSLLYQRGSSMCFSDLPVFDDLPAVERRRLLSTLTRIPVVFMKLHVTPASNLGALVEYWWKQGNAQHVKCLLERLVKVPGGTTVDVAHLLPSFARKRLYTFPYPSTTADWERQDCFWTSMNFFNDLPDDRVPNLDYSFNAIKKDYYQVQAEPTFGDMVTLVDAKNKVKHCCIYVADDVVFTKNGGHFLQPWALMRMTDMLAKYPADPPLQKLVLRSKKS